MKYIVVLCDGAADTPVPELNGKTPLEAANKPNIDLLASMGEMGMVTTVPDNLPPEAMLQTLRFSVTTRRFIIQAVHLLKL